jgi:3-oxoacyl-[acyl-carrier protein] reductase
MSYIHQPNHQFPEGVIGMIDLSNQVAFVTGGSRGIGAATAVMLAQAGADVGIMFNRNKRAAEQVAAQVHALGKVCHPFQGDLQDYASCRKTAARALKEFGRIDILVNSGGIWEYGPLVSMTPRQWKRTLSVNLDGTFNMCRLLVPAMKSLHYGRIINISSTAGQRGEAFHSHYAATKGAIISFTKSIAVELIAHGIWVNCVAPGWVLTDMTEKVSKDSRKIREILSTIPRKKLASPQEIAGPILFLASSLSNHIIGEVLNVNGGSVLCG